MQHETKLTLPAPDAASAAQCEKVAAHLRKRIGDGDISFAEFVSEALYAPGLGYYAAGSTKFGEAGDFITAPEVSSLYGAVLARQALEVLESVNGGVILEYGAGSGKLAVDLIRALERKNALPERYQILEVSPDLQERQEHQIREAAPYFVERVEWLSQPPKDFRGVMIANEVLDALPFERFMIADNEVRQMRVTTHGDEFVWTTRLAPEWLASTVRHIEDDLGKALADGFISEVSLATGTWVADLAASLEEGAIFLFDYGISRREYYSEERNDGWLRCHFRHHAHNDPLILTGIQDITTWVDFTAVAEAAQNADLDILGFTSQAQFLIAGGLDDELAAFAGLPVERQMQLSGQVKTLTLPGEMGENFKCIALGRGDVPTPTAFRFADRTQTL